MMFRFGRQRAADQAAEQEPDDGEFKPCPDCDNEDHCTAAGSCRNKKSSNASNDMTATTPLPPSQMHDVATPTEGLTNGMSDADAAALCERLVSAQSAPKRSALTAADVTEIVEIYTIAGNPGGALQAVKAGMTPQAVRAQLLDARARQYEATAVTPINTATAPTAEHPLIAAIAAGSKR